MKKILGIGNALVDILATLKDEALLHKFSLPKGSMQHIDDDTGNRIWKDLSGLGIQRVAGGCAANTIAGAAQLGMGAGFIGKVGHDELGTIFAEDQHKHAIRPILLKSATATGRCMVFISPDTERTMATYLGAAVELTADDLSEDMFAGYDYFHIEGYLVQNHALIKRAVQLAKAQKMIVSLDMASYNVVEANKTFLLNIVKNYVDIVFANEAEAEIFTGKAPQEAVGELSKLAPVAVVKIGAEGSLVQCKAEKRIIAPFPAKAVDATGAGDLYAAGFLYGHALELPLENCGIIGSLIASKVVEVIGPKMDENRWHSIQTSIQEMF